MIKRIATLGTGLVLGVALTLGASSPSQADTTGLTTPFRVAYHVDGQGYHFVAADSSVMNAPPRTDQLAQCQTAACRASVVDFYAGLHSMWQSYNAEVWTAEEGLPDCSSLADAEDCVFYDDTYAFTVVKVNGVDYFVQTSTDPG